VDKFNINYNCNHNKCILMYIATWIFKYVRKQIKSILKINWTATWAKGYLMMSATNEILCDKKSLLTVCSWSLIYRHYTYFIVLHLICFPGRNMSDVIVAMVMKPFMVPVDPCMLVAWLLLYFSEIFIYIKMIL